MCHKNQKAILAFLFFLGLISCWTEVKSYSADESSSNILAVQFSHDNAFLYSGGENNMLQKYSVSDYSLLNSIDVGGTINNILVHPTTGDVYISTTDGQLKAYSSDLELKHSGIYSSGEAYDIAWKD